MPVAENLSLMYSHAVRHNTFPNFANMIYNEKLEPSKTSGQQMHFKNVNVMSVSNVLDEYISTKRLD